MTTLAPRLLLVANAATQAMRLASTLGGCGFSVDTVESAEAALDGLDRSVPALMIVDFHLPGMSGTQMVRQLRLNGTTRTLPVILLTEGHDPVLERDALLAGIDACVSRSADVNFLAFRIHALLRGYPERPFGLLEPFRRAVVAVVTAPTGRLAHWPADESAGQRGAFPILDVLRADGMDAMRPEVSEIAAPERWRTAADCVIVDLTCGEFDGLALCRLLDMWRSEKIATGTASMCILGFMDAEQIGGNRASAAYMAGVDELICSGVGADLFLLHVRALLRRRLVLDETRRTDVERAAWEHAMAGARAKTVLAEALEQANEELANANRKLIEAQSKLVQSAKMASLGELVAGIAHEFNNPLAFVLAHEDTVLRTLDRALTALDAGHPEETRTMLTKSRERIQASSMGLGRMRDLVSSLRRFSRLDQGSFGDVDMPEAIRTVLALLAPKLADRISVECDFRAPSILRCQTALAHQVVMNIVSNAADAFDLSDKDAETGMPGPNAAFDVKSRSPRICIRTRCERRVGADPDGLEEIYVIEISDNGPGIPPFMRERVFEPFFTTKPVGEGTGLGLATAYGVVRAHGGHIDVGESPEGGASFAISIPMAGIVPVGENTAFRVKESSHERA